MSEPKFALPPPDFGEVVFDLPPEDLAGWTTEPYKGIPILEPRMNMVINNFDPVPKVPEEAFRALERIKQDVEDKTGVKLVSAADIPAPKDRTAAGIARAETLKSAEDNMVQAARKFVERLASKGGLSK